MPTDDGNLWLDRAEDAKRWRDRAEEVRLLAATMTSPEAERELLEIAAQYELLARHAPEWTQPPGKKAG
jgi:hypothetical protein